MSDSGSKRDKKLPRGVIPREKKSSYIHIRVDPDFKEAVVNAADEEDANMTEYVVAALQRAMNYIPEEEAVELEEEEEDEEEEDKEERLLDEIISAMENLERRMEIRLATLQDTFNSLIGRLLDFEKAGQQVRKGKKESAEESAFDLDLDNVLQVDPEKLIYQRVKRYIEAQGAARLPSFDEIMAHLETDAKIKEYLENQDKTFPGWRDTLVRDAIDEAIDELGIPIFGGID